jgi:ATP/maltotriose-dependent transcriptional regulator MalT
LFEGLLELDHAQWLEQRGAPARAEQLLANMQALLEQRESPPVPLRGRIALRRGRLALCMGQENRAAEFFRGGLDDCLRSHDKRVLYGFLGLAQLAANHQDYAQAFGCLRDAERLMQQRQIPDTVYRGVLLQVSSQFWLQQGRPELAEEALSRVLRHFRGAQARQAPPATFALIARLEYLLVTAQAQLRPSMMDIAYVQHALEDAQQRGMVHHEAELQLVLAHLAWIKGDTTSAQRALELGQRLIERNQLHQTLLEFQLRCGDAPLIAKTLPSLSVGETILSRRELEVLCLIAQGESNQKIAESLYISLHTVKTHARRINAKLGVERRTQAVAKAKVIGLF